MENRNYDFEWGMDIDKISEFEKAQAENLVSRNLIKDVYKENNNIIIEYLFKCQDSFISNLSDTRNLIKKMKVPLKSKNLLSIKCAKHNEYNCKFSTCIIIAAAYLFYLNRKNNFYNNVIDDIDVWEFEEEDNNQKSAENKKEITDENILDIFSKE